MMTQKKLPAKPVSAVQKTYELGPWLLERIAAFPRSHRFTLGEKIESVYLEVLELLIQAAYSREKLPFLSRANTRIEVL